MYRITAGFVLMMALGGCLHDPLAPAERLSFYRAHAGRPVEGFAYARNMRWIALGDHALAVWTRRNEGYLIDLRVLCSGLEEAMSIQIHHVNGQVTAGGSSVRVLSMSGSAPISRPQCPIMLIRPLDAEAMRNAPPPSDSRSIE
ncbi:MAG TPA: DUF6491 family protein [Lysobacter sp.]